MKKYLPLIVAVAILLTLTAFAGMSASAADLKEGAKFYAVDDVTLYTELDEEDGTKLDGSKFYIYVASELYNPGPMMTPIIYVYADQPYATEDDAWAAATELGLIDLAEAEHAAIILVNRYGEAYDRDDVDLFESIMAYIYNADGTEKLTWHNLQYVIGEGSGATFINDYLTQNAKRIAAVMTFGGDMGTPYGLYPLPAYIVGGTQKVVDYYISVGADTQNIPNSGRDATAKANAIAAWEATETEEKTTYVYTLDDVKQVIVSKSDAAGFDKDLIADAWTSLFRVTARPCMVNNFWNYYYTRGTYNTAVYTLYSRPDYEAAGMDVIKVLEAEQSIWPVDDTDRTDNYWYEFVPKAVKASMESGSSATYPLMLCFHGGGDHPIYEAESIGWSQLCIDHNIIMVSPNGSGADESKALIEYMIEKYPVDISRIYVSGFSGGAGSTLTVTNAYPELFAAAAPQSRVSGPYYTTLAKNIALGKYDYDLDLPIMLIGQGKETESTDWNDQYVWYECVQIIKGINEIKPWYGKLDFEQYPYWGFPLDTQKRILPKTGFAIWTGALYDDDGVPLLALTHSETLTHTHYPAYAEIIWDWFEDFARNPVTKEIIYAPVN